MTQIQTKVIGPYIAWKDGISYLAESISHVAEVAISFTFLVGFYGNASGPIPGTTRRSCRGGIIIRIQFQNVTQPTPVL